MTITESTKGDEANKVLLKDQSWSVLKNSFTTKGDKLLSRAAGRNRVKDWA